MLSKLNSMMLMKRVASFNTINPFYMNIARMMFSTEMPQPRPTQYGQAKFNINGIKYNKGPNYGKTIELSSTLKMMDFTANSVWDNPGARRIAKQVGRGPASGKG